MTILAPIPNHILISAIHYSGQMTSVLLLNNVFDANNDQMDLSSRIPGICQNRRLLQTDLSKISILLCTNFSEKSVFPIVIITYMGHKSDEFLFAGQWFQS